MHCIGNDDLSVHIHARTGSGCPHASVELYLRVSFEFCVEFHLQHARLNPQHTDPVLEIQICDISTGKYLRQLTHCNTEQSPRIAITCACENNSLQKQTCILISHPLSQIAMPCCVFTTCLTNHWQAANQHHHDPLHMSDRDWRVF